MNNKILLLMMLLSLLCVEAIAQKTRFGFAMGINSAKMLSSNVGFQNYPNSHGVNGIGYTIGFFADVPLRHNFSFEPSINIVTKQSANNTSLYEKNIKRHVGELNLNYTYRPIKNAPLFIGAGPSFSLGTDIDQFKSLDPLFDYNSITRSFLLEYGCNVLVKMQISHQIAMECIYNLNLQIVNRLQYFCFNIQYHF